MNRKFQWDVRLLALYLGTVAMLAATPLSRAADAHHTVVAGDAVKWGRAPASLPPDAEGAVLLGDAAQPGPFVLRLRLPAGFAVAPHRHTKDEFLTVIAGRVAVGSGEKLDRDATRPLLPPASFVHLPAGMPHYVWVDAEANIQINGTGPFDVVYVDPKDDPRRPRANARPKPEGTSS